MSRRSGGADGVVAAVFALSAFLTLAVADPAGAQSLPVGDPEDGYLRLLQLEGLADPGSFTVRPLSIRRAREALDGAEGHPWAGRFDLDPTGGTGRQPGSDRTGGPGAGASGTTPGGDAGGRLAWTVGDTRLRVFANSHHPRGQNDGAVWQGKGLTTALQTRASVEWRALSVTLDPTLIYNGNGAFDLAPVLSEGLPEYAYPWWRLDHPQRFGPDSFWTFDWGQSQIALDWKAARVSFGTENMVWGPAVRNPIVMSANAGGFPHAALGTNRPVDIGIGTLEGNWIWGRLGQSDWFDPDANPDRYTTGLVLSYSPSFLGGLTVGFTRMFQELVPDDGLPFSEFFLAFQGLLKVGQVSDDDPDGTDERDQLLSLFARWAFPESGFEAYFEWARNDHAWDLQDLLLEPQHSQGYTLGFQKVTGFSAGGMVVVRGELTHLEAPSTFQVRPRGIYYTHSLVTQGYTHEGQILGAGIGPGSNAQMLAVDVYRNWGSVGLLLQREVHDNDAYWVYAVGEEGASFDRHDVSFDIGASGTVFVGEVQLGAGLTFTRELNRYFFGPKVSNFNLALTGRWRPASAGR